MIRKNGRSGISEIRLGAPLPPLIQTGMSIDPQMDFEVAMRQWFGEKAWGIAGSAYSPATRNKWLRKWIQAITVEIQELDTDANHKHRLLSIVDSIERGIRGSKDPQWAHIFSLLELVAALFGRLDVSGRQSRRPFYAYEDFYQYIDSGENIPELGRLNDRPTILSARLEAVSYLEGRGMPLWRIAQALNTTVYQLKKLRAELGDQKAE
jgi:hypothetical protein